MPTAGQRTSTWPAGRRDVAAVATLIALGAFLVAERVAVPIVLPDEVGSIVAARWMLGAGDASPWWYLPGYGVLLTPVVAVADRPEGIETGVHLVNALLLAATFVGLSASLRRWWPGADRRVVLAAALATAHPAYVYFSTFALADNAIVAIVAWTLPALASAVERRPPVALAIGAGLGATAVVHSRLGPTLVAVGLWLGWQGVAGGDRSRRAAGLGVVGGSVVATVVGRAIVPAPQVASALAADGRQSLGALVGDSLSVAMAAELPVTLAGQLLNLAAGSAGLVLVGAHELWRGRAGDAESTTPDPVDAAARAMAAGIAAAVGLSLLFTNGGVGDFTIYGRYVEVVVPLALAIGVGRALGLGGPLSPRWSVLAGLPLAGGLLLAVVHDDPTLAGRLQRLNVAGLALPLEGRSAVAPWAIAAFGVVFTGAVLLLSRRAGATATATALAAVFGAGIWLNSSAAASYADTQRAVPGLVEAVETVGADPCVALDQDGLVDFTDQERVRLHRLEWRLPFWTGEGVPPCPLVLSSRTDLGTALEGWRPLAVEAGRVQWLWASPERTEASPAAPLAGATVGGRLPRGSATLSLEIGTEGSATVTVRNESDMTFVPVANLPQGQGGVQVGLEWRDAAVPDVRMHEPVRIVLPLLTAGSSATVTTTLDALPPEFRPVGPTLVHAELVQEGVGWLPDVAAAEAVE